MKLFLTAGASFPPFGSGVATLGSSPPQGGGSQIILAIFRVFQRCLCFRSFIGSEKQVSSLRIYTSGTQGAAFLIVLELSHL